MLFRSIAAIRNGAGVPRDGDKHGRIFPADHAEHVAISAQLLADGACEFFVGLEAVKARGVLTVAVFLRVVFAEQRRPAQDVIRELCGRRGGTNEPGAIRAARDRRSADIDRNLLLTLRAETENCFSSMSIDGDFRLARAGSKPVFQLVSLREAGGKGC